MNEDPEEAQLNQNNVQPQVAGLNEDLEGPQLIKNNGQPQVVGFDINEDPEGAQLIQNNGQPQVLGLNEDLEGPQLIQNNGQPQVVGLNEDLEGPQLIQNNGQPQVAGLNEDLEGPQLIQNNGQPQVAGLNEDLEGPQLIQNNGQPQVAGLNEDLEGPQLIQNNGQPQVVGFDINEDPEGAQLIQNNGQPQVVGLNEDLEGPQLIQNNGQPQVVGFDINEDPEGAQLIQNNGQSCFRRLVNLVTPVFPALCILFQLVRLASLVMFSIFAVDCTLLHNSTSVDCTNFTVYSTPLCDPYCWKTVWLVCSISTSIAGIFLLNRTLLPDLRPVRVKAILKCLVRKPSFWLLNFITVLVVVYDVLIIVYNENAKKYVECLVILSKLCTLYLSYQLNFTFPPFPPNFRPISRAAYYITLSIFVLDNLCKFLVLSAQVAFKFYTVNHNKPGKPLAIITLVLMVINTSLYHKFLQFFWQKLFRGDKDILTAVRQNFVDTTGIREHIQMETQSDGYDMLESASPSSG